MRWIWLVVLSACGSQRRGEPIAGPMDLSLDAARGRQTFLENCHQCHPGGEGGLGPALSNAPAPVWLQRRQVRLGAGAMPAFGRDEISGDELDDLATYLREIRRHRPKRKAWKLARD